MAAKAEGTITFWLRHEHPDWVTNESGYDFEPVQSESVSVEVRKEPEKTVAIKLIGPYDQSFLFHQPIPPCDDRGLFVALTWKNRNVTLHLNGKEVDTSAARDSA